MRAEVVFLNLVFSVSLVIASKLTNDIYFNQNIYQDKIYNKHIDIKKLKIDLERLKDNTNSKERYKIMNSIKRNLQNMSEFQRVGIIENIKNDMNNHLKESMQNRIKHYQKIINLFQDRYNNMEDRLSDVKMYHDESFKKNRHEKMEDKFKDITELMKDKKSGTFIPK